MTAHAIKKSGMNKTSRLGLSEKEAKHRLQKYGPNTLKMSKKISAIKIFIEQFCDFMIIILLACTAISMLMGEVTEAVTIIAIIVLNSILGFIQEYRTEKTIEALKNLAAPVSKVIRNGKEVSVPAEELVPGDLIIIETGDRIPADAQLVEANNLQVDEALLTGECIPVEKSLSHEGRSNEVYMGTVVTNGRAKAVVYATGMNTEMGKIADMIQNIDEDETPLQKRLEQLGKYIVYGCLIICAIVSATGIIRGESLFTMLLAGISLAVAAVPEGLPAIVTIALALGVQRMMKRNALIRKLPAVETLGCASVICSDKTGTLTENKMTVRKIYAGGNILNINSSTNKNTFILNGKEIDHLNNSALKLALEIGVLCNNSKVVNEANRQVKIFGKLRSKLKRQEMWKVSGDPTEGALVIAYLKAGFDREILEKCYMRIDEIPFDSERKCMTVVCRNSKGEIYVLTKGAPDVIIDKCNRIYTSKGISPMDELAKSNVLKVNDTMAGEALRILGLAYKKIDSQKYDKNNLEKDLIFVGLSGMIDPPRKEAVAAVQKCKMAGIKTVMITGDHKITATAIAKEMGIYEKGDIVLTGAELDNMDEEQLEKIAPDVSVYARVSPKHKMMIVRTLKRLGNIVAMTGDGVNDAPAVKEADIGVSMGITGTDVTKEASAMILMDDNFATIVAAIEEGRVIYDNIRKFIRYLLSCNLGEVLTMFLGMLLGMPLPLLPIQILWVNLVTDGLPAIALGLDPPDRDIMKRPPRNSKEHIFSGGLLNLILFRGVLIGLSSLAVFACILYNTNNLEAARTGAFMTLVFTQLVHVFECKSERRSIFEIPFFNNIFLVLAVMCSLTMILGVVYIPYMQKIFKTVPLTANELSIIGGITAFGPVLSSLFALNKRRRRKQR